MAGNFAVIGEAAEKHASGEAAEKYAVVGEAAIVCAKGLPTLAGVVLLALIGGCTSRWIED